MGRRYSIADVRRTYTPAKARQEWFGDWASALIYRPLSFCVTPLFIRLGFSAQMVTALSLAIALLLPLIALFGGGTAFLWVAGLASVWVVLDCVDGNVARLLQTASRRGHYSDFAGDVVFRGSFYAAIGLTAGAMREGGGMAFALCMLAFCIAMAARCCRVFHRHESDADVYDQDPATVDRPRTPAQIIFSFLSGIDRLLPFMVLAGGLMGEMNWIAIFLVVYSGLDFLYTQISIVRQLTAKPS